MRGLFVEEHFGLSSLDRVVHGFIVEKSSSLRKLESEVTEFLDQQVQEAINGSLFFVQNDLHQGSHLTGSVPPIGTVQKNIDISSVQLLGDVHCELN